MNNEVNQNNMPQPNPNMENGLVKNENVLMGVVGAFIGSLAGVAAIVLLQMIGFVASISGVLMGYATIFMYKKLAGTISKKGVIISIIVMIVMVVVGENLAWSILIAKELNVGTFDIFPKLYELIKVAGVTGEYIGDLVLLFVFTALGAFGVIRQELELIKNS